MVSNPKSSQRVLFDPELQLYSLDKRESDRDEWYVNRLRDLYSFRVSSYRYSSTKRYRDIVNAMLEFEDFERLWHLVRSLPADDALLRKNPTTTVRHHEFKEISFWSLRLPQKHLGFNLNVSVYVPLFNSLENYMQLKNNISPDEQNEVHFFKEMALD